MALVVGRLANGEVATPPLPQSGARMEVSTILSGTGGTIWPCAGLLTAYLLRHREDLELANAAVIELGSGTGIVGLYAAALGARQVLLTDVLHERRANSHQLFYSKPTALGPLLQGNVQRNCHHWNASTTAVNVAELSFGDAQHVKHACRASPCEEGFDILLGSDITFRPVTGVSHEQLTWAIVQLLRPGGVAILCHETRLAKGYGHHDGGGSDSDGRRDRDGDTSLAELRKCIEAEFGMTWRIAYDERPSEDAAQNGMLTIVHIGMPGDRYARRPSIETPPVITPALTVSAVFHKTVRNAVRRVKYVSPDDATAPRSEATKDKPDRSCRHTRADDDADPIVHTGTDTSEYSISSP